MFPLHTLFNKSGCKYQKTKASKVSNLWISNHSFMIVAIFNPLAVFVDTQTLFFFKLRDPLNYWADLVSYIINTYFWPDFITLQWLIWTVTYLKDPTLKNLHYHFSRIFFFNVLTLNQHKTKLKVTVTFFHKYCIISL